MSRLHVGNGHDLTISTDIFCQRLLQAVKDSSEIFEYAAKSGHTLTTLNIGGGFLGYRRLQEEFFKVAGNVSQYIKELSSKNPNIRIIAEPGKTTEVRVVEVV